MNIKSSVMTVVAGLAFAAVVPAQAQVLGGTLGGAGNVVLGGGGIAGDAGAGGTLNSDLRDRMQAARERTQSTAESTADHGRNVAAKTRAGAEGGINKARAGAKSAAQDTQASGSAASSTSVEKHAARRTLRADSSSAADYSADRSGLIFAGSQATNASMTRDEPASADATPSEPQSTQE